MSSMLGELYVQASPPPSPTSGVGDGADLISFDEHSGNGIQRRRLNPPRDDGSWSLPAGMTSLTLVVEACPATCGTCP